jgi:O-antigen/teichoic acid export membrane protein
MVSGVWGSLKEPQKRFRANNLVVARIHWKNPVVLLPSGILDMLSVSLPLPLLSARYGVGVAGTFLIVQRLSMIPAGLLATSVGDVFHATVVDALRAGDSRAKHTLNRWAWYLLRLGSMVMLPATVLAPFGLPWLLGPQWKGAGLLFSLVAPWSLASLIVSPLSRILLIVERKELKLGYDIVALTLLVGTMSLSAAIGLGLEATVAALSAGQVAAYALYFLLLRKACDDSSLADPRSVATLTYDESDSERL